MFDTMTLTKIVGAVCGSLLVFLLGKWGAELVYEMGGGHGGEEHIAGYVIETGGDEEGGAAEEDGPTFEELLASADLGKGEKVFAKCRACHAVDGQDKTGPHLNGVVNRAINGVDGFGYSGALAAVGDAWTPEALSAFLENPKGAAPGTSMSFAGLKKDTDRANIIAWLASLDG